jgi:hypothetical protein
VAATSVRASLLLLVLSAAAAIMYFPGIGHVAFITPFALVVFAGMLYRLRRVVPSQAPAGRAVLAAAWVAGLALVGGKLWTNREFISSFAPLRVATAFGTLATGAAADRLLIALHEEIEATPDAPAHLFAYPGDAWIYLALPADNPTPFALLRPVYNTPQQMQTSINLVDADPQAVVLVNTLFARNEHPMLVYLNTHFGKPIGLGAAPWILYKRTPPALPAP